MISFLIDLFIRRIIIEYFLNFLCKKKFKKIELSKKKIATHLLCFLNSYDCVFLLIFISV